MERVREPFALLSLRKIVNGLEQSITMMCDESAKLDTREPGFTIPHTISKNSH